MASLETREVWVALAEAHRHLAELKGLCESLPNQGILLDTLGYSGGERQLGNREHHHHS